MKYDTKEVIGKYIIETVFKTNKEKLEYSKFCNKLFFVSNVEPISLLFFGVENLTSKIKRQTITFLLI
jgi:hypothetical protein